MHCDTLKQDNDSTVRGDGEVGSARYEPALLPPCPSIRVLSYSNCQEIHPFQQTGLALLSVKAKVIHGLVARTRISGVRNALS